MGLFRFTVFFSIVVPPKSCFFVCNGVLGEVRSPNEASGTLGKWLATCVPRHHVTANVCLMASAKMQTPISQRCCSSSRKILIYNLLRELLNKVFCFPFFAVSWRSDDALFTHSFPPNGFLITLTIANRAGLDGITPPSIGSQKSSPKYKLSLKVLFDPLNREASQRAKIQAISENFI